MTIYIALLRGINVGGHKLIKMAELRNVFETMGLGSVQTYIQSGNVLFESEESADLLSQRIEHEISRVFGFTVPVILRTEMELEQIIRNCPFQTDALLEGESLHISFLAEAPSQEGINHVLSFRSEVEECRIEGKEVYLFFRQSIRNSKLAAHLQKLNVPATLRNWRTINKLNTMAQAMRD
ncbi:DUF1697 domain-containing protein [Bacillus sp. DX1.1]|uniref:DUF1697 domain-containing protein n=1 Tax=unclassified Bacillus (in: firmicutes) TaxID=185979 RepID=UPI00257036B2|nr:MULTISPECIES: DUF1697 domain-containing protein [unclassified Bacillus (in: firmicutes)]MDM5155154.1 DUF1697 domain-containing protein [Bacillus sp. DX1.1]WJE84090.1 DUF1697 domain-containing protein [Bacillus sp. DX3.1]